MKLGDAEMMLCPYLGKNCVTEICMMWVFTKTKEEATTVTCHRCYEKVRADRTTCSNCDAFIRGFGAEIPLVDLQREKMEGKCLARGGCNNE